LVDVGILILRITLGIVLIPHGVYKFQKKQFFDKKWREEYGLPGGSVLLTGIVQVVGGLAIILGVYSSLAALIQVLVMVVATSGSTASRFSAHPKARDGMSIFC
jgi:uncharacterized membrane protein YphA (DoxX/SURF4 family)